MEAFTNRQLQWELVTVALTEHLRQITEPGFDVEDLERPRTNVMVFHGVGGIGKTTLSRKLEAALTGADQLYRFDPVARRFVSDRELLTVLPQLATASGRPVTDHRG